MFNKEGLFRVFASGAVVRKHCGVHNNQPYAYITLVRVEQHKEQEYKHYADVRLSGNDAKYVESSVNKGDSIILEGQLVTTYQGEEGNKQAKMIVRADSIQSHRLPSGATMARIQGGRDQAQQPSQPVPAEAQQAPQNAPQQMQAPQSQQQPPMDFDDDIPF